MSLLNWRTWLLALPIALMVGCTSTLGPDGGPGGGTVRVTIQGQFEKQILTPGGFAGKTTLPIRHSYIEVRQSSGDSVLASGYLGSDGTAAVDVPPGTTLYTRIYAEYEVTGGSATNDFFQHGGVINQPSDTRATFTLNDEWSVASSDVTANSDGTLTVTATTGNRIAGAFNINDQMLSQGLALRNLDPNLRLPTLFAYWSTTSNPGDQLRTYPSVMTNSNGNLLTMDGRALFKESFNGLQNGGPDTETDEWDDGVIQENSAHLLFANYSSKGDGSNAAPLLRRDNDNVYVSRYRQSESTVAFVGGFCDFLAGALNNNSLLLDSYVDGNGTPQVEAFDLSRHDQVSAAQKSEFTRGSVAVSLWGIWKNALTGDTASLTTLWQAARSSTALPDGTGEYAGATLGCYPSYLVGVRNRVSGGAWSSAVGQLGQESIQEPTPAYFNSSALWLTQPSVPFSTSGTLQAYDPSLNRYYDRNQSAAFRFTQSSSGSRTITMVPTGGQDFWVEVIGNGGVYAESPNINDSSKTGQTQNFPTGTLPPGVYAVRVRAGATTASTTAGFTLSVQ